MDKILSVNSEIGTLRRLLVHSPDSGLGKVVPSKAQDWLFEDIVHLDTIRRNEYDYYTKLLLYFLNPEKIKGHLSKIDAPEANRNFYKPEHPDFFASENVVELEWLLAQVLADKDILTKLVASVCAIEGCTYRVQNDLLGYTPAELAKTFISGTSRNKQLLFAPIPNFIFTRDIGITIKDHVLLNKPAKKARTRETLPANTVSSVLGDMQAYTILCSRSSTILPVPSRYKCSFSKWVRSIVLPIVNFSCSRSSTCCFLSSLRFSANIG